MPGSGGHPRLPSGPTAAVHPGEIVHPFRYRNTGARPSRSAGRASSARSDRSGPRADSPEPGGRTTALVCAGGYRGSDLARVVPRVPVRPGGRLAYAGRSRRSPPFPYPPTANVCSCRGWWWLATGCRVRLASTEPDEGPGLTWRQLTLRHWSGTWDSKTRGTVTRYGDGRVANLRLEDPPGLSPIHRRPFDTVEAVQSLPTRCGRRGDPHRTAAVRVFLIARGTVGTLPLRLSCCG
jgi:hypothetical protein